jgi:hypothetical protein
VDWWNGLQNNTNAYSIGTWDGSVATERLSVSNDGKVGIGSTTPTVQLDVVGSAKIAGTLTLAAEYIQPSVNSGVAVTLGAISSGSAYRVTLTGNATITLPSDPGFANGMAQVVVVITQDGTGSRTLAWAAPGGDTILWASGVTPTVCSTASQKTIYQFVKINGDTNWYASQVWRQCP